MALTQCFNGVKEALFQRMDIELLPTTIFSLSLFIFLFLRLSCRRA